MTNNKLFKHIYSLEQLIEFFAKNSNETFYLNTKTGEILQHKIDDSSTQTFAFKPIDFNQAKQKVNLDNFLSLEQALNTKGRHKRDVYNFVKSQVLDFLAENNILPPSLNPIISFREKAKEEKIKVEIKL